MRWIVCAALSAAMLVGASPAAAATLYASPDGGDEATCPESAPCSLPNALFKSGDNDTILLLAGTYTTNLHLDDNRVMRGAPGTRPRLVGMIRAADASQLIRLAIEYSGTDPALHIADQGRAVDVSVRATEVGVFIQGGVLRDALVVANGANAVAVRGKRMWDPAAMRNVTAIATGPGSVGFAAEWYSERDPFSGVCRDGILQMRMRTTILRGDANDISITGQSEEACPWTEGRPRQLDVDFSNFRRVHATLPETVVAGPHNQTTPALTSDALIFADTTLYRQRDGAPTANAGDTAAVDSVDLDGDPRSAEGAPDIGADELPPLTVSSVSVVTATGLMPTTAALAATVSSLAGADVRFEYGTSTAYGATTPAVIAASGDGVPVESALADLTPSTTYHVRAIASDRGHQPRMVRGPNMTFTTPAAPLPPPLPSPQPVVPATPIDLVSALRAPRTVRLARLRRAGARVRFSLLQPATYSLRLTARLRVGGRRRIVVLASRRALNQGAGPVAATMRLTRAGRRAVVHVRQANATLRLVVSSGGRTQTRTATVNLRR